MPANAANPRVSALLQAVTGVEVLVLFVAGFGLLVTPATLGEIWPWRLTPFNAAFLGAIYSASMVATFGLVMRGRWSPARVVVPMILVFSAVVLAVSLADLGRFAPAHPATWLWFLLYVGIPLNAAAHLWLYRTWPPAESEELPPFLRTLSTAAAVLLALYGVALLAAPAASTAFWPWPIDAFHARVYSVVFLTPAAGLFLLARSASRYETLVMAGTLFVGGVLAIASLVIADVRAPRVDWSGAGTWAWIAIFAVIAVLGVLLFAAAQAMRRPAGAFNESALAVPLPAVALLLGLAFVAAGIAGFIPFFTPPPAEIPAELAVRTAHGHLLGLYPVNAVHSLFHLTVGVLGLAAFFQPGWALAYVRGFAIALAALTVMGLLPHANVTFGLAPLYGHDVWLHGAEALGAGYIGWLMPRGAA